MRPVNKGSSPYESIKQYSDACPSLITRLGEYCSYCEFRISHVPEVEHVISKSEGGDKTAWNNLLLGCKYCNTRKLAKITPEDVDHYVWPDTDNTAIMFSYKNGYPSVNRSVLEDIDPTGHLEEKAYRLFHLVNLGNIPKPKEKDRRFSKRNETFQIARYSLEQSWALAKHCPLECYKEAMKNQIIETAKATGFFSVWMEVFSEEPEMLRALINAFPGTAVDCFDEDGHPLAALRQAASIHKEPALAGR